MIRVIIVCGIVVIAAVALISCKSLPDGSTAHLNPPDALLRPLTAMVTFETPDRVHALCAAADGSSNKQFHACTICTPDGQSAVIAPVLMGSEEGRLLRHELGHVAQCFDSGGAPMTDPHDGWK